MAMSSSAVKSFYTKETAERLDTVRKHGKKEEIIPGRKPSQRVLEELKLRSPKNTWPRYEPAYRKIKEKFPEFTWNPVELRNGRKSVLFYNHPNPHISLAEIVLESMRRQTLEETGIELFEKKDFSVYGFKHNIERRVKPLLFDKKGEDFARVLIENIGISYPPMVIMERVAEWFYRAMEGESSTIITPICPDYETEETGDPSCPRAYTFEGLGDGIGLVGQRALGALPEIYNFFRENKIFNVNFIVPIGDFEANSEETRQRVGVTKEEFLRRLRCSQRAFQNACPIPNNILATPFMTEMSLFTWEEVMQEAENAVKEGNYGALGLQEDDLQIIAKARTSLYERWYGEDADFLEILKRQIPEYLAMGDIAEEYPNSLILGADAPAMAAFMQGTGKTIKPVLYLKGMNY